MNDDETLPDAPPIDVAAETAPTPAATKAPRRSSRINIEAGTVEILQEDGKSLGVYAVEELPETVSKWLMLSGLRHELRMGAPASVFAELKAGTVPAPKGSASLAADPWRQAYAHALAEDVAKSQGVQKSRGGRETPEYQAIMEGARAKAAALSKDGLKVAKTMPPVIAHHDRLTGRFVSLADLA